jgi:hypothetical protein
MVVSAAADIGDQVAGMQEVLFRRQLGVPVPPERQNVLKA